MSLKTTSPGCVTSNLLAALEMSVLSVSVAKILNSTFTVFAYLPLPLTMAVAVPTSLLLIKVKV